eukprot:jgi/Chlat1/5017/Chrsp32S04936
MLSRMIVGRRQVLWEAMGLGEGGGVAEAPLDAAAAFADRAAECQQKRRKKKRKQMQQQQQKASAAAKPKDERANNKSQVYASKRQATANATVAAESCQDVTRKPMKKRKQRSKDGGRSCVEQVQSPPAATVTEACGNKHRVKRSRRDQVGHREPENACVASLPHLPDVPSLERQLRFNTAKAAETVAKEQLEAAALAYATAKERTKQLRLQIKIACQSTPVPPATDSLRSAMVGGPQRKDAPQAATPSAPEIGAHEGVKTLCDGASSSSAKQALRRHLFTANSDPEVQSPPTHSASNQSFVPSTIQTGCSRQPHADHHAQEDTDACADSGMLAEAGVQARSAGGTATLRTQEAACGDSEHQAAPNSVDQGKDWRQQAAVLDGDGHFIAAELPARAVSPVPMLQPPLHQRLVQRETVAAHGSLQNSPTASRAVPLPHDAVPTPHAVAQDAVVAGHSQSTPALGSERAAGTCVPSGACDQVQAEGLQCHAGQTCSPGLGLSSPVQSACVPQAANAVSDIQGTVMRDDAHLPPPQPQTSGTAAAELLNSCQCTPRATEHARQTNNELPLEAPSMEALNGVCDAAICRGSHGVPPYALGNATNARAIARRAGGRTGGGRTACDQLPPAAAANEPVAQEADASRRLFAKTSAAGARGQAHASGQHDAQGQGTPNVRMPVVLPSRIPAVDDTIVIDSDSEPVLQPSHAENEDAVSGLEGGSPQSGKRRRLVKLGALQQQPHVAPAGLHPVAKAAVEADAGATMETTLDTCFLCCEAVTGNDRMVELPCGHKFHIPCVSNWLINCQNTCPQCRARITDVSGRRHNQSDEATFLLCDGCCKGAHFQCIGLATATFPGGWFCDSCYISGTAHKMEPCASCEPNKYTALECRWFHGHHDAPFNWFYYRDVPDPVTQGNPDRRYRAPAPTKRPRAKPVKLVDGLGPCMRCKQQRKGAMHCRLTAKHPPTMV